MINHNLNKPLNNKLRMSILFITYFGDVIKNGVQNPLKTGLL